MPRLDYLLPNEAWEPDEDARNSFEDARYKACRLHGSTTLVRLLSHAGVAPEGQPFNANRQDGSFWFAQSDFQRLKSVAESELKRQSKGQFRTSIATLVGVHIKTQLRSLLAVRRDWTPSFDYYVDLFVPQGKHIIALTGKVKKQPVYSPEFPGADEALRAGLGLPGGFTQYVIDFKFPSNQPYRRCISNPVRF